MVELDQLGFVRPLTSETMLTDDTITSKVRLFGDDAALYMTIEGEKDSATLQQDFDKLSVWEREWDMEFNPTDCQVI